MGSPAPPRTEPLSVAQRIQAQPARSLSPVLAVAAALVAAQTLFRSWALAGGWFYVDDFRLIGQMRDEGLSLGSLLEPYDNQLMPLGRLLAWVVASADGLQWWVVVVMSTLLQASAGAACVWALVTLFGRRWAILPPLCLYLFTTLTLPAFMWWAASLNQLPLQLVTFLSVGLWVGYLRRPSRRRAAVLVAVLALGLLAYVKTLFLLPLLLGIQLFYFTSGPWRHRWAQLLPRRLSRGGGSSADLSRRLGPAVLVAVGAAYVTYYSARVAQPLQQTDWSTAGALVDSQVLRSYGTGVLGGPWRWSLLDPPTALAFPPVWLVFLSWVVVTGVVLLAVLTRRHAWYAWVLLAGYLAGATLLLLSVRGGDVGAIAGLEYRYLTDLGPVTCLLVAAAYLPILGASTAVELRAESDRIGPRVTQRQLRLATAALTALVVAGGTASSVVYVRPWHSQHPAADYLQQAERDLRAKGRRVPLTDETVPTNVMPSWLFPYNTTAALVPLLGPPVSFPDETHELFALAEDGSMWRALVDRRIRSRRGPVEGCGWRVEDTEVSIPMRSTVLGLQWWARIAYAASSTTPVTLSAGDTSWETTLRPGAQSLYLRTEDEFDEVTVSGLANGASACIDLIEVGEAVPGLQR